MTNPEVTKESSCEEHSWSLVEVRVSSICSSCPVQSNSYSQVQKDQILFQIENRVITEYIQGWEYQATNLGFKPCRGQLMLSRTWLTTSAENFWQSIRCPETLLRFVFIPTSHLIRRHGSKSMWWKKTSSAVWLCQWLCHSKYSSEGSWLWCQNTYCRGMPGRRVMAWWHERMLKYLDLWL